ncbi:MAG: hypothetical protein JW760_06430 [Spirochaetales bacterium]|nr:hypothetical protein [Spirochaetales bacterium]
MKKEPYSSSVVYRPLHLFSDNVFENRLEIPLSSRNDDFHIDIDFSETINLYNTMAYLSTDEPDERTFLLYRRELVDPESPSDELFPLTFSPEDFISGQTDLPADIYSSEDDQLNMALFVVPYGYDTATLSEVFGDAASLGYIRLHFRY